MPENESVGENYGHRKKINGTTLNLSATLQKQGMDFYLRCILANEVHGGASYLLEQVAFDWLDAEFGLKHSRKFEERGTRCRKR